VNLKGEMMDNKYKIYVDRDCQCIRVVMLSSKLTGKEAHDLMKELQKALFEWHELTGEKIGATANL